jgi:hypothetical protein
MLMKFVPTYQLFFFLNISNIRFVTRKPPTTLIVAMITAPTPSTAAMTGSLDPAATMAPTTVMPEMALEPDMSGVCKVGGTLVITSNPTKMAKTKTVTEIMKTSMRLLFLLERTQDGFMDQLASMGDHSTFGDFVFHIQVQFALLDHVQ